MEQIYYTQCPVGYGLGASNGFQVKRVTPGYPLAGDFRHLGLRAFPAGGRSLAPASLRYRRAGESAEVAWLTPRPMEYETERGLWGRPGGHFAHGLILDPLELAAIDDWPAGLFDRGPWRRSDPEPSRGRPPDPLAFSRDDRIARPDFASVVALADGLDLDVLARLLTALAAVAREGRTLFLIDEPGRLGPRVALLTFLVPPPLRALLTFSTYHDRPEELPGYRIHGTTPAVRPNRGLLLTQGVVADLTSGSVEPRAEPSDWAREVARWVGGGATTEWADFARRLAQAAGTSGFVPWDDAWLDRLVGFGRAIGRGAAQADWAEEVASASWASGSGLAAEWSRARGPDWWRSAEVGAGGGRRALGILAGRPETWDHPASAWGEAVARWFADASPEDREAAAVAFAKGSPSNPARFAFVQALRRGLPDRAWAGVRRRLDAAFRSDPRMVALWAVPEAVAEAVAGKPAALVALAREFDRLGEPAEALLDAARGESEDRSESVGRVAEALAALLDRPDALRWALGRGDRAIDWLRPSLRRRLALPDDREGRQALLDATPTGLRPALARAVLDIATEPGLPDDAFTWGVEDVLLPIPEADRPASPDWPGRYLDCSASDLALIGRVLGRASKSPGLRGWLDAARERGDLAPTHVDRLDHLRSLARALVARDPAALDGVDLARVPGPDRGRVLARLLRRDAAGSIESGPTLDRCGASWPESLAPGSPDLPAIAGAVADSDLLAQVADDPSTWRHRLGLIVERLDPGTPAGLGSAPDGLVARVVARRNQAEGPTGATWRLRNDLFRDEAGWRLIAGDFRLDLLAERPEDGPAVVGRWDDRIDKGIRSDRFWELALNVCDGPRLAAVVSARAKDLGSLGPLAWWDHRRHPGARDDLRDAFARLAPMAPLDEDALAHVRHWLRRPSPVGPKAPDRDAPLSADDPEPGSNPGDPLSPLGRDRWECLDGLTKGVFRRGIDDQARRFNIRDWRHRLPLGSIPVDDRYRLVAWVVYRIEDPSAIDVEPVGKWLVRSGVTDLDRLARWPDDLAGLVDVPPGVVRARIALVDGLRAEMRTVIAEEREGASRRILGKPDSA